MSFLRAAAPVVLALLLAACAAPVPRPPVPEPPGHRVAGYLPPGQAPDSLALIPPPPAPGSAALALDLAVAAQARTLRDGPRWQQARRDADLGFPAGAQQYACALGIAIDADHTPHLYRLLSYLRADGSAAARAAKKHYDRLRPFAVDHLPSCTPEEDADTSGSYPSGHTTIGWAWALVLAELAPERASAILQRGRSIGDGRLVCHVHWNSDVVAGRTVAAALVARLHDDPLFRSDLAAARKEIARARAAGRGPLQDCATEVQALRERPADAL